MYHIGSVVMDLIHKKVTAHSMLPYCFEELLLFVNTP